ncbi:MAG: ABC transporter permease, partial [Casimicrobiaceae bacterium]
MAALTQAACVSIVRATLGGALGGNRMRVILAVLAIALGVALGFAVQLINQTAIAEFASGLASLAGDTDLEVRGARAGFDDTLYPALVRDRDVAAASPVIEIEAKVAGRN